MSHAGSVSMRFVRLTLSRPQETQHRMQTFVERADSIEREWNLGVANLPDSRWSHLYYVEGDLAAYRSALEQQETVERFDLTPAGPRSFYAYVVFRMRPTDEEFADAFDEHGVVVVPPVESSSDGTKFTLVGPPSALRALLEDLPDEMRVDVLRVGEFDHRHGALSGRLTTRQREAVTAALALDYYGVPHDATLADVAEELGCSVGTASTLLRRAERAVMEAVIEG